MSQLLSKMTAISALSFGTFVLGATVFAGQPAPHTLPNPVNYSLGKPVNTPANNLNEAGNAANDVADGDGDGPEVLVTKQHPLAIGIDAPVVLGRRGLNTSYGPEFQLTARVSKGINLFLVAALENVWQYKDHQVIHGHDWTTAIDQGYVSIDLNEATGKANVVIIAGKRDIPIGQFACGMTVDNLCGESYDASRYPGATGVSFEISPKALKKIFDKAVISVFKTEHDSFSMRGGVGASVTVSKKFLDAITLTGSYSAINHNQTTTDPDTGLDSRLVMQEMRASLGLVYQVSNDPNAFTVYGNVFIFKNYENAANAHYLLTAGMSRKFGKGTLSLEANLLDKTSASLTAGYSYPFADWIDVGPVMTWRQCQSGAQNCVGGLSPMLVAHIHVDDVIPKSCMPAGSKPALGDPGSGNSCGGPFRDLGGRGPGGKKETLKRLQFSKEFLDSYNRQMKQKQQ